MMIASAPRALCLLVLSLVAVPPAPASAPATQVPGGGKTMDAIVALCRRKGFIFQSSEIYGGLGSAVAEVLAERYPVPLRRIGYQDVWMHSGSISQILVDPADAATIFVPVAPARLRPRAVPVVLPPPAWVMTQAVGSAPVRARIS